MFAVPNEIFQCGRQFFDWIAKRASDVMTQTTDSDKQTGMVDDFEEVKRKLRLRSLYFPQNALMLREWYGSREIQWFAFYH